MIVSTPGALGGKPRIDGHRIAVEHVAHWRYQWGWSVETIMAEFNLTREQVQAALDYYAVHKEEIDAHTRENEAIIAELEANAPRLLGRRESR